MVVRAKGASVEGADLAGVLDMVIL